MTIDESPAATTPTAEPVEGSRPESPRPARAKQVGGKGSSGERSEGKRTFFILLGAALFFAVYFAPLPGPAIDPEGQSFALTPEGKAALALFFLAATWWVTEVVPIGVTSIAIGVMQGLFLIRPADDAFSNFMVPSVWFIFGSLIIGMVFTKTGLTRRLAY
ncbi:MAG: anion permease, partial [Gemmatimonadetes bacterium]|nr:anion permease [Gemmatimonadota bacterium]